MKQNLISSQLANHYRETILSHGPSARGVDWGDEMTATVRHDRMRKLILSTNNDIILLDVGCGYGSFLDYLKKQNIDLHYHGIDIVEEMISLAKQRHSKAEFIHGNFFDYISDKKFDYVVCNGILTQKLDVSLLDMEIFSKQLIKKVYDICEIGCCFNIMSTRCNFFSPNLFYRHPSEILTYCLSEITQNVVLDHSYGLYEFTVYLYK